MEQNPPFKCLAGEGTELFRAQMTGDTATPLGQSNVFNGSMAVTDVFDSRHSLVGECQRRHIRPHLSSTLSIHLCIHQLSPAMYIFNNVLSTYYVQPQLNACSKRVAVSAFISGLE